MPNDPKKQEAFDHLLAKGMKLIYSDKSVKALPEVVTKHDPVLGLKNATQGVMDTLQDGATKAKREIPREMRPDLALGFMEMIRELVSKKTGQELPEEMTTQAFEQLSEDGFRTSLKNGSRTPEDLSQHIEQMKGTMPQPQTEPQPQPQPQPVEAQGLLPPTPQKTNDPFEPEVTMTQRLAGGLL